MAFDPTTFDWWSNVITPGIGAWMGSQTGQGATQTQSNNPYFQPYQEEIANWAQNLYSQPTPQYQGQTWAGPTQYQMQGWDQLANWSQGTPYTQALSEQAGNLLNGNPFQASQNLANQNTASQQVSNNAIPTAQTLGMARDATAQFGGASAGPASMSQGQQAVNPYIGANTGQIAGVGDAYGRIYGELPSSAQQATATGASAVNNPMFGLNNPYTNQAIDAATQDVNRQFSKQVMPQLDRLMQQSGSFGNTGVQDLQRDAMSDYTRNVGNIANDMRYKDLFAQQQLGEGMANRNTGVNTFNAGAQNTASLANANAGNTFALGRAGLLGGLATSDLARGLNTQQFNAGLSQADLARNAGLAQGLGQFNANLGQQNNQFNAGAQNSMNQFNAGLGQQAGLANMAALNNMQQYGINAYNQGNQFNAAQGNNMNQFNAQQGNALNQFNAQQGNAMGMYNTGMNWNALNTGLGLNQWLNNNALNQGQVLTGVGQQQQQNLQGGLSDAYAQWAQQANAPYSQMQQYANLINSLGGNTQSTYYPGNPFIGGLGGAMTLPRLFGY